MSNELEGARKGGELIPLFVRPEKNLIALGFFTPTSKRLKTPREKVIHFKRTGDGGAVEGCVRIVTAGRYGLPGTGDLDKYLALYKIFNEIQERDGELRNPISFATADILTILGRADSGKNYKTVDDWLGRMYATTIEATGVAIFSDRKEKTKERNRVFERVVTVGKEIERGVIAERNHIWLSGWMLESINSHQTVPVDFETYCLLSNPVAKVLVPLLQIWFYASRSASFFEKDYGALCQLLGIEQYPRLGLIKQKLKPAMDELLRYGYIRSWDIEGRRRADGLKLILGHGEKFRRDLARHVAGGQGPKEITDGESGVLKMLDERGLTAPNARKLLRERGPDQSIEAIADQIEFIDYLIRTKQPGEIRNPPGLYYRLIKDNVPIPPTFETARQRKLREQQQADALAVRESEYELRVAYDAYRAEEVRAHIRGLAPDAYQDLINTSREKFQREHAHAAKIYNEENTMAVVTSMAEKAVAERLPLLSFEDFRERRKRTNLA